MSDGVDRGKQFEDVVKTSIEKLGLFVYRLYDTTNGFSGIANISDFVVHSKGKTIFLECKSVHGNRISISSNSPKHKYGAFSNRQWEGLLEADSYDGVNGWSIIWWIDHDITAIIPISVLDYYRLIGKKSISYKDVNDNWIIVPGKKKRVFFDYDFGGIL